MATENYENSTKKMQKKMQQHARAMDRIHLQTAA